MGVRFAAGGANSARLACVVVLAVATAVLAIPIGGAPIWAGNDARWVLLARDVVEHGRWLMPEIRGLPNEGLYKPQLFTWSIALASLTTGHVTEFTAAFSSAVSALATVGGIVAIGSLLWSVRAGALSGLILTTTLGYFVFAQRPLADVMMSAFMVWALYFVLRARRDGSLAPLLGFYACVGAAMLSKGPPGLAALVAAAVATWRGGGRPALQKLRLPVGALVLGVFALPWIVPYVVLAGPAFVHEVLFGEYAHWFVRRHGLAYRIAHMPSVLLYFLPWSLFLPAAIVWWRRGGPNAGRAFVLWWTITLWMLVGLSGVYSPHYFLPIYPGLAIVTGEFFARATASSVRRQLRLGIIAFIVGAIAVLVTMVLPFSLSGEGPVYMPDRASEKLLIGCLVVIGAAAVAVLNHRGMLAGLGIVIAVVLAAILAIEGHTSAIRRARYYDVRALGAAATTHTAADGTVFGYPDLPLAYDVYVDRRIVEIGPEELGRLLAKPSRDVVIMTRRRWIAAAQKADATAGWRVLEGRNVGGVDVVVVGAAVR